MAKKGGGNQPYSFWTNLLKSVPQPVRAPLAIFMFLITLLFYYVFPNQQPAMLWALFATSLLMLLCIFGFVCKALYIFITGAAATNSTGDSRVFTRRERSIAGQMILLERGQIEGTNRYISGQLSRVSQDSVVALLRKIES